MSYSRRVAEVERSFSASFWLKGAVTALASRDPVDAYADALALAKIQRARLNELNLSVYPQGPRAYDVVRASVAKLVDPPEHPTLRQMRDSDNGIYRPLSEYK